jgi:hypothetical protein
VLQQQHVNDGIIKVNTQDFTVNGLAAIVYSSSYKTNEQTL